MPDPGSIPPFEIYVDEMAMFTRNVVRIYVKVRANYSLGMISNPDVIEANKEHLLRPDGKGEFEVVPYDQTMVRTIDENDYFLDIPRPLFEHLLEAMLKYAKRNGIEPDSLADLKATLRAKEEHLEDFRNLVQQKFNITLPQRRVVRGGSENGK